MTEWGPGLIRLGLSAEDWGPNYRGTYQQLVTNWRGSVSCPGETELLQAIADQEAADQSAAAAVTAEASRLQTIKNDALCSALVTQLKTSTAAQISSYVDAQVTDLASARTMLKRIILVLARLSRQLNGI